MTTVISSGLVTVVKYVGAMEATVYKDELSTVLGMMQRGSCGGGFSFGCFEHKAALDAVEQHLAFVRKMIAAQEQQDALRQEPET